MALPYQCEPDERLADALRAQEFAARAELQAGRLAGWSRLHQSRDGARIRPRRVPLLGPEARE
jgi:hypothetical protein